MFVQVFYLLYYVQSVKERAFMMTYLVVQVFEALKDNFYYRLVKSLTLMWKQP